MAVGLLGMTLLFTGCGGGPTRLGHMLFDGSPFESVGSSKYDKRALAAEVEKDPFPKAKPSHARAGNVDVDVQQ